MIQILSFDRMSAGFMFQYDKHIICAFRYIISQHVNAGWAFSMLHKREHLQQFGLGMWPGTLPSISSRSMKQISQPSDCMWCKRKLSVFKNTPYNSRNKWTCEKSETCFILGIVSVFKGTWRQKESSKKCSKCWW